MRRRRRPLVTGDHRTLRARTISIRRRRSRQVDQDLQPGRGFDDVHGRGEFGGGIGGGHRHRVDRLEQSLKILGQIPALQVDPRHRSIVAQTLARPSDVHALKSCRRADYVLGAARPLTSAPPPIPPRRPRAPAARPAPRARPRPRPRPPPRLPPPPPPPPPAPRLPPPAAPRPAPLRPPRPAPR